MRIGAFSKYVKTTAKTLRYYDRIGLFCPAETDPATGYRNYTLAQLADFEKIRQYRAAGLSVEQIRQLLAAKHPETILHQRQQEIAEQEKLLHRQKTLVAQLLDTPAINTYAVQLKELPSFTVCTCRTRVSDIAHIPPVFSARFMQMKETYPDLTLAHPNYCCVSFTDPSHHETDIEVEYAEAVTAPQENRNGFLFKTLPSGLLACVEHYGPYEDIAGAYAVLFRWLAGSNYQMTGSVRERFIHGAWDTENEAQWLAQIQVPVKKGDNP